MKEIMILAENEVLTEGWPSIYYWKEPHRRWCAFLIVDDYRFDVEKCNVAEEAIARIERMAVEEFEFVERRHGLGRRKSDRVLGNSVG